MALQTSSAYSVQSEDDLLMGHARSPLNNSREGQDCSSDLRGCSANRLPARAIYLDSFWEGCDHHAGQSLDLTKTARCGSGAKASQSNRAEPVLGHYELRAKAVLNRHGNDAQSWRGGYSCISPASHVKRGIEGILSRVLRVNPAHENGHCYSETRREDDGHTCHNRFNVRRLDHDLAGPKRQPRHPKQPDRAAPRDHPIEPVHGGMIARCYAYSQASEARV